MPISLTMNAPRTKILRAAAGFIGCLGIAHGAITHVDPADIVIPANFDGIYVDLETGATSGTEPAPGSWDLNLIFGGAALIHNDSINIYRQGGGTDALSAIVNLGLGDVVDGTAIGAAEILDTPSLGASGAFPADNYMGTDPGQFTSGTDGYLGFVLNEGTTPLYGWARVEFKDDGTTGLLKEWAYSDSSIMVGQVPETSVSILLLGATSCLLLRRRRLA